MHDGGRKAVLAYGDVRELTRERLFDDLGFLPNVIAGSPPCQDASQANARGRGVEGQQTGLFLDAIGIVASCRPAVCAFENVIGLTTRGLDEVLCKLAEANYSADVWQISADNLGAPHRRRRLFIIGVRRDIAYAFSDTYEARLAVWQGQRYHQVEEQPTVERVCSELDRVIAEWSEWNGGGATIGAMADGVGQVLDRRRAARASIAAVGDSVMPDLAELIGHTLRPLLLCEQPTVLELFSGAVAGWSVGLHRAGYRTVAMCELDEWRRAVALEHLATLDIVQRT